jgi:hypothetical protein
MKFLTQCDISYINMRAVQNGLFVKSNTSTHSVNYTVLATTIIVKCDAHDELINV